MSVEETIRATVIRPNQALKLRARRETVDRDARPRVTGEEVTIQNISKICRTALIFS